MEKRAIRMLGFLFLIIGFLFLSNFSGITGFVVFRNVSRDISGIFSLIFILTGVMLIVARKERGLEKIVLISKQAIARSEKDSRVRQNMQRYAKEIEMIAADPSHRPQEMIGQFHVSPRSRTAGGIRVAWHRKIDEEKGIETIYIDDFLYHATQKDYVGKWNRKVGKGEITLRDYEFAGA